jgi:hypothetical protein
MSILGAIGKGLKGAALGALGAVGGGKGGMIGGAIGGALGAGKDTSGKTGDFARGGGDPSAGMQLTSGGGVSKVMRSKRSASRGRSFSSR